MNQSSPKKLGLRTGFCSFSEEATSISKEAACSKEVAWNKEKAAAWSKEKAAIHQKAININTAAEILNAFREYDSLREKVELFNSLATRPDPPIEAFVELVKAIKLETVLALTILAFGKIASPEIKSQLKESTDLLELLSQKIESGSSDLIQWSAATAIEEIGFDFLLVSQYLSEDPKTIIDNLLERREKDLSDKNKLWIYLLT